jgi:hypothetical protein
MRSPSSCSATSRCNDSRSFFSVSCACGPSVSVIRPTTLRASAAAWVSRRRSSGERVQNALQAGRGPARSGVAGPRLVGGTFHLGVRRRLAVGITLPGRTGAGRWGRHGFPRFDGILDRSRRPAEPPFDPFEAHARCARRSLTRSRRRVVVASDDTARPIVIPTTPTLRTRSSRWSSRDARARPDHRLARTRHPPLLRDGNHQCASRMD